MKASTWAVGAAGIVLFAAAVPAQRTLLPAECRQETLKLCRGAEGGVRRCLSTALPEFSEHCAKAISDRQASGLPGAREHAYGADPKQRLDLVMPQSAGEKTPLLLFIHGGGWAIGDKTARVDAFVAGLL